MVAREREWTLSWSNRALGRGPPDLWAGEGRTFGTDPAAAGANLHEMSGGKWVKGGSFLRMENRVDKNAMAQVTMAATARCSSADNPHPFKFQVSTLAQRQDANPRQRVTVRKR